MVSGWSEWYEYGMTAVGIAALGLAVLVFRHAPGRPLNRAMAYFLFVSAAFHVSWLFDIMSDEWPRSVAVSGWAAMYDPGFWLVPTAYLIFIGHAVPVRSTALLRRRAVVVALVAVGWIGGISTAAQTIHQPPGVSLWTRVGLYGIMMLAITGAFGIAVAVINFRAAPRGSPGRRRALAYLMAFGARDTAWFLLVGLSIALEIGVVTGHVSERVLAVFLPVLRWIFFPLLIAYMALLSYGVLSSQILDIDMKIKITVKRSTVAAAFVGVFFVVGLAASEFLVDSLGYTVGAAAAGVLLFALKPLQRFGERIATVAVPAATPLQSMTADQKRMVYEDQLTLAWADGVMSARERDILESTRHRLGLDAETAAMLENQIRAQVPTAITP